MMDGFFNLGKNSIPRIGDLAPAFRSVTTQGTIYFPADYFGKWVILFCYPGDFLHNLF
jgi:peroxiredoxin 2/4